MLPQAIKANESINKQKKKLNHCKNQSKVKEAPISMSLNNP